jgi:hypothetical protein
MNFSTILKGAAVAATFALVVSEASAQLPVRTQSLQLLGTASGRLTQLAGATTTDYSVTWPSAVHTDATNAYLQSASAGGNSTLSWVEISGSLIDGSGANGEVAYFTDGNTIASSPTMTFDGAGKLNLGGAGAGSLVLGSSGAGNNDVTINSNSTTGGTFNLPTYGATTGPFEIVATTNTGTDGQIAVVQANGSIAWEDNPISGMQRGTVNGSVGFFTTTITVVGTPDLTDDVIIVSTSNSGATGNILQVTAVAADAITVSSTAPFDATDRISWLWIPVTP